MKTYAENKKLINARRFDPDEDAYLIANADTLTQAEMAAQLGRSIPSVNQRILRMRKAGQMGESKRPWKPAPRWSKERDEWLMKNASYMSLKELADRLGLKPNTVSCHLSDLRNKGIYKGRKAYIRPKTVKPETNTPNPLEMLCWYCRKATNPPGNDCPWSGALRPVSGWTVTEREIPITMKKTGETTMRTVHNVTKCPLFEEG